MHLFNHEEFDHELVIFGRDERAGLRSIIAIHSTQLGPAIGGCRMMPYGTEEDALTDVLRLSKGMSYKCAIGNIPFGGGKAVIIGDPTVDKTPDLLRAMGDFVDKLNGRYITSFDAGTTLEDVAVMGERTQHVGGIQPGVENASASTAYGIYVCMREAATIHLGNHSLSGLNVAIQGAGNVGSRLAQLVSDDGGHVTIADVRAGRAAEVAELVGGKVCTPESIATIPCDIFAPCALGSILTQHSVEALACKIVCGGANNQLSNDDVADQLKAWDIFYCPDYLANAGGIIDLHYQLNAPGREALESHLDGLADTLRVCHERSRQHDCSMATAANRLAEQRFLQS